MTTNLGMLGMGSGSGDYGGVGFDASQSSNKYSLFNKKPFPWPSQYEGDATDAHGNVIPSWATAKSDADAKYAADMAKYNEDLAAYNAQLAATTQPSTFGTGISNTAAGAGGPAAGTNDDGSMGPISMDKSMTGPQFNDWVQNDPNGQAYAARGSNLANAGIYERAAGSQLSTGGMGTGNGNPDMYRAMLANAGQSYNAAQQPQQQRTAAPTAPTQPTYPDMSKAYLDALANPGPLKRYGASPDVVQSPLPSATNSVIDNYLASLKRA